MISSMISAVLDGLRAIPCRLMIGLVIGLHLVLDGLNHVVALIYKVRLMDKLVGCWWFEGL